MSFYDEIVETIKKPFLPKKEKIKPSSEVHPDNIDHDFSEVPVGFYDDGTNSDYFYLEDSYKRYESIIQQKSKIENYRKAAKIPEVSDAIDEVVNEATFVEAKQKLLKLKIDMDNEKLKDAVQESFNKILKLLDTEYTIYHLVEKFYVDGQLNIHSAYNSNREQEGIKELLVLSPYYFYFDVADEKWKYLDVTFDKKGRIQNVKKRDIFYDKEEIARVDSGMYETTGSQGKVVLGYLENALKSANQLQNLEDMLIPLRFSRSVSRRVFNVDVGDLPDKKATAELERTKNKFKYKKFYDTENGTIANQQHIVSMVEDYWFANRNGSKGTTVDTIDETGNLGELDDILYFQKKIYRGLKVPSSRASGGEDGGGVFDVTATQITREELKFFSFIQRFRKRFVKIIKELLKREVLSTRLMTAEEWVEFEDDIEVYFTSENKFYEKMKLDKMMASFDMYQQVQDDIGTMFSVEYIYQNIFDWTEEEFEEIMAKIAEERGDDKYKEFYKEEDDF